ncbi:MAG: hypothetical protein CMM50_12210 [Rhodospirillaceae bacterium]|nr:hypothetical protein [Rhodospirillaceae bacterium]
MKVLTPASVEFSRPTSVAELDKEIRADIEADEREREALARRFDLMSLDRLRASVRIAATAGGHRIRVEGTLDASVVQTCVVTLKPVESTVQESFAVDYVPESDVDEGEAIDFDPEGEDPPEVLRDWTIDIGELVAEQLSLALDPYPRHPSAGPVGGAVWQDDSGDSDEKPNPFAVLAQLRKSPDS